MEKTSIRDAERDAANRIHSALKKRTELKWEEETISEAMKKIPREFNIIIELDLIAIEDAGYAADEPVSVDAQRRALFATLNSAFSALELTFVIVNEAMLITTNDSIDTDPEKYLNLGVYRISDLQIDSEEIIRANLSQVYRV